ncbi:MAG: hypothetical protein RL607_1871, partial [Bacteroidota bacterium]
NKRIILCKPKNLGLSMEFVDYDWNDISGTFVKEGILGSDFTFTTKSDLTHTVDYLPKNQARKLYTFAKEQLDALKNPVAAPIATPVTEPVVVEVATELAEEPEVEEVTDFAEIMPTTVIESPVVQVVSSEVSDKKLSDLSKDELFEKLQNYKKLLDNGLILQGEYDRLKSEILQYL